MNMKSLQCGMKYLLLLFAVASATGLADNVEPVPPETKSTETRSSLPPLFPTLSEQELGRLADIENGFSANEQKLKMEYCIKSVHADATKNRAEILNEGSDMEDQDDMRLHHALEVLLYRRIVACNYHMTKKQLDGIHAGRALSDAEVHALVTPHIDSPRGLLPKQMEIFEKAIASSNATDDFLGSRVYRLSWKRAVLPAILLIASIVFAIVNEYGCNLLGKKEPRRRERTKNKKKK
eukprot:GHVU01126892.1.p1 GENE.GHVU01126892.1~~GHVU01126892.1.p1  ORF type:complete len:237 (-),score=22.88 GHVU01126892.1:259-969(-)